VEAQSRHARVLAVPVSNPKLCEVRTIDRPHARCCQLASLRIKLHSR
jgi:hypothetical protein